MDTQAIITCQYNCPIVEDTLSENKSCLPIFSPRLCKSGGFVHCIHPNSPIGSFVHCIQPNSPVVTMRYWRTKWKAQ